MANKNTPKIIAVVEALRPIQWTKNLGIFASIIINGKLFQADLLIDTVIAFITFCLLSSSSYLINDLIDLDKDRLHPVKKNRPLASGAITKFESIFLAVLLLFSGLYSAFIINPGFFGLAVFFITLQYLYSILLKKKALLDISGIALFFIIRTYAGEVATGYHLPVWLMLSVIFLSLFIASGKRRSELVSSGKVTRQALQGYSKNLLNFYTSIFAVSTLLSYAMFTFFEENIIFNGIIHNWLLNNAAWAINRKWFMVTLFPVIFGIMRYGQIIFEMQQGERPEKVMATDLPLLFSLTLWGILMITIIYVI